jgi:hypothetical protein
MKKLILLSFILILIFSAGCNDEDVPQTATYKVTFSSVWSKATHPADFPRNPHFSGLIGATHNDAARFWQVGGLASPGIKNMAETGVKSPLDKEILRAMKAGRAGEKLSGSGMPVSPGKVELTFKVSREFPRVTLVSMIAPSPDWFVGVSGLPLFENGDWVEKKIVELYPYDAGTDSGRSYASGDKATKPQARITRLKEYPLAEGKPLGTFTFTRQ